MGPELAPLLAMALDLTRSLGTEDRYRRLLETVEAVVPCDAACLLRVDEDAFVPVATRGLTADTLGRRFRRGEHPRLDIIAGSLSPVRFPPDVSLPDPFDGMLGVDPTALADVHACLGCPLTVEGRLVGVLTADSLIPDAFEALDLQVLSWLGALAGAAMQTSQLISSLEASAQRLGLVNQDLMRSAAEERGTLLGTSASMQALRREIDLVAGAEMTVLITGETGTGKELVARALHRGSPRLKRPLIYVNCAALPESVAESELFGHVRGAFTGAESNRAGKLEVADGGTLLLDEVGELPPSVQPKLLRALQEGEIQRVGSDQVFRVDVRVLAATNRELEAEVAAGRFREDLFHRLNVYRVHVPPLRERRDDVALLAGHFSDQTRLRLGCGPIRIAPDALDRLASYEWPGNVRELDNLVQRAVLRAAAGVGRGARVVVRAEHLADGVHPGVAPERRGGPRSAPSGGTLTEQVDAFRRGLIARTVAAHDGNWAAAARELGMHRSNLHHLAKRLGLR